MLFALHMSAFGGKADMTIGTYPLLWSLSGVKQTSLVAAKMSAFDSKRTSAPSNARLNLYSVPFLSLGGGNETARFHIASRRYSSGVAARRARAASWEAADNWVLGRDYAVGGRPTVRRLRAATARTWLDRWSKRRDRGSVGGGT